MANPNPTLPMGSRHANLNKSFQIAVRSLLTSLSKEDVRKAFSTFTNAERESLYRMFVQVIKSMHESIEEEFESISQETKVGSTLDMIEQLVEEQSLDFISADKTNIGDAKERASRAKMDEIQHLTNLLEKAEEQKNTLKAHREHLKARCDLSVNSDHVDKLRSWM